MTECKNPSPIREWWGSTIAGWATAQRYRTDRLVVVKSPQVALQEHPQNVHATPVGFALQGMVLIPMIIELAQSVLGLFLDLPPTMLEKARAAYPATELLEFIDSPQANALTEKLRPLYSGLAIVLGSIFFRISFTRRAREAYPSTQYADRLWLYYVTGRLFPPMLVFSLLVFTGQIIGRYQSLESPYDQTLLTMGRALSILIIVTFVWALWTLWGSSRKVSWALGLEKDPGSGLAGDLGMFARLCGAYVLGKIAAILAVAPAFFIYVILRW